MPLGFKPNYDSGWDYFDDTTIKTYTHSLGSKMLKMEWYFKSTDTSSAEYYSVSSAYNDTVFGESGANEDGGHSVYMVNTNQIQWARGNHFLLTTDNIGASGGTAKKWASGYIRVLIWKTGVAD